MRYWDSSALVPLVCEQGPWREVRDLVQADPAVWSWWGSEIECVSALVRLDRERQVADLDRQLAKLATMAATWRVVPADATLKAEAARLLRAHALSAADALQLAAAVTLAAGKPAELSFITLDRQLARAAGREGLELLGPMGKLS